MKNISSSLSPLDTCNACDLEVKTPNKMGYCDSCLSSVSPAPPRENK